MAETILFGVAQGILSTLGSMLLQEMGLVWGVKDEFQKLQGTVSTIQAVLLDAEEKEKSESSNLLGLWLTRIKEAMHDAENLLDDFSYEALRRKVMPGNKVSKEVRLFFSSSNQPAFGLKMAHRIRNLRIRLDAIAADRLNYGLVERLPERPVVLEDRRQTHSHPPSVVVGRDVDKDAVLELLLSQDCKENVGIVPIVGIGGLGKTTLAQLVVQDERVETIFELKIWICVSDADFNVKVIVKKILDSFIKEKDGDVEKDVLVDLLHKKDEDVEMDVLVDLLHKKIKEKKYLLILDDFWNEDFEKWTNLKDLLLGGAMGSRIIVTTRLANVAEMIRPIKVYNLQFLSTTDSWSLFAQTAFHEGENPSQIHREIGKEIVEKCSGVPLAIKVMGSLLYHKPTISEWSSFRTEEFGGGGQLNIIRILKISYDHLPLYLKHCFAYCCLFPKGHMINVPKLITLWMAQGYLNQQNTSRCLEDIGLEYFMGLLWRSFFQEVKRDRFGNVEACKLHDLIHDLARQVVGSDAIVSNPKAGDVHKKTRHVSFNFDPTTPWKLPISLREVGDVRTFLLLHDAKDVFGGECRMDEKQWDMFTSKLRRLQSFLSSHEAEDVSGGEYTMDEKQWDVFTRKLRRLRSLDLHSCWICKVPRSINKLKHLKELDLSYNKGIKSLPNSITQLYNLQVLRLNGCSLLTVLPEDIHKLINLSQLDLKGCDFLLCMPRGLGQLTSLHILMKFVVPIDLFAKRGAGLKELRSMNNLRGKLKICNLINATSDQAASSNLKGKEHLQRLTLDWEGLSAPLEAIFGEGSSANKRVMGEDEMTQALEALEPHRNLKVLKVRNNEGLSFPMWLSSLTNLVEIQIWLCGKCQYIPPLHQLPYLQRLNLYGLDALEYVDSGNASSLTTSSFFPSLEVLEIRFCLNLKGWRRPLTTTPDHPLPRLQILSKLVVRRCPNLASMPLFPPLKSLEFGGGSVKSLQDILKAPVTTEQIGSPPAAAAAASSSSISIALSQLQNLMIYEIEDLEYLPEDLFCHMGSLKALQIHGCGKLQALGRAVGYLTSLESLDLAHCSGLKLSEDESDDQVMHWQALRCFRSLYIWDMPFESMPNWLRHLQTIQGLRISACQELVSLPAWLVQLTNLEKLIVDGCTNLSRRCGSNKGEDWPCISHVPDIIVNNTIIQMRGRYLI